MFKIVVNNSRIELYNVDRLNGKKKGLQGSSTHINMIVDMRTTMAAFIVIWLYAHAYGDCHLAFGYHIIAAPYPSQHLNTFLCLCEHVLLLNTFH
mgnify:CR=1 FL=1